MRDRYVTAWIGGLLTAAGTLQAWTHRSFIHPDGLSYIDIAEAYARGDLQTAINPVWSPLLAWLYTPLIALGLPRDLEPAVFHLLNLPILLLAYIAFAWLAHSTIEDSLSRAAALIVFAWTQIQLMPLWYIGGDRLAAAFLFLALALLINRKHFLGGVAFGFAYLAKAIMLPVAIVTLPLLLLRRAYRGFALAVAGLLLVSAPWITALSLHEGKLTYSEVGRLAYMWDVAGVPMSFFQGDVARRDSMAHPPRILIDSPRVYEFATPFSVTYPLHFDATYWYEGAHREFDAARQLRVVVKNLYETLFMVRWLLVVLLASILIAETRSMRRIQLFVIWPALAGIAAYWLRHVEPRYVSPFVALVAAACFSAIVLPRRRITYLVAAASVIALFIGPASRLGLDAASLVGYDRRWAPYNRNPLTIQGLRDAGVGAGDRIATIGYEFYGHNARVVGARIVAAMDRESSKQFWRANEDVRQDVYRRLRAAGVDVIISEHGSAPGWRPLGKSGMHIFLLE